MYKENEQRKCFEGAFDSFCSVTAKQIYSVTKQCKPFLFDASPADFQQIENNIFYYVGLLSAILETKEYFISLPQMDDSEQWKRQLKEFLNSFEAETDGAFYKINPPLLKDEDSLDKNKNELLSHYFRGAKLGIRIISDTLSNAQSI